MDEVFKENFFVFFLMKNQKKEMILKLYENQPFISISNNLDLRFNNLLSLSLMKENLSKDDISGLTKIIKEVSKIHL